VARNSLFVSADQQRTDRRTIAEFFGVQVNNADDDLVGDEAQNQYWNGGNNHNALHDNSRYPMGTFLDNVFKVPLSDRPSGAHPMPSQSHAQRCPMYWSSSHHTPHTVAALLPKLTGWTESMRSESSNGVCLGVCAHNDVPHCHHITANTRARYTYSGRIIGLVPRALLIIWWISIHWTKEQREYANDKLKSVFF
jgi:hypothetical protein